LQYFLKTSKPYVDLKIVLYERGENEDFEVGRVVI
jgi:hypothetical protein